MNRREFAKLSGFALAANRLTAFAQDIAESSKPIGYAAIGLGTISEIFMRGCAKSQTAKITALVTGHPDEKGAKYAALYGIPKSSIYTYEQFDRIRDNAAVDAVYVGLPNSLHREFTVRAAQAGKHVLCEKPMAISSAECREMIDACRRAKVKLMIAYRCHYDPSYLAAERIVQSGVLGQLQTFEGAFGFDAHPNQWRLTKQFGGGGSLLDVGIYPLNAMRFFSREEPSEFTAVTATRDHSGRFAEVEQSIAWTMKFPSGITASAGSSYGADVPGFLRMNGTRGSLELSPAYRYDNIHLSGSGEKVHADTTSSSDETAHFRLEAEHFAHCIRARAEPKTPGEEGLKDFVAMEAIYKAAGAPIA